ncbi:MAG: phasin family protein [Candidatus Lernaella stagnicola]|nr:phasin family protein [Candidatus Lernaella stagnicola]
MNAPNKQDSGSGHIVPELLTHLWDEAQKAMNRTEAQISTFTNTLVDKGTVTREEATRAFADILKRMNTNRKEMAVFMDGSLDHVCRALHIPTRTEMDTIRQRIDSLRKRIDAVQGKIS